MGMARRMDLWKKEIIASHLYIGTIKLKSKSHYNHLEYNTLQAIHIQFCVVGIKYVVAGILR